MDKWAGNRKNGLYVLEGAENVRQKTGGNRKKAEPGGTGGGTGFFFNKPLNLIDIKTEGTREPI